MEIESGGLQKIMSANLYLCDFEHSKKCDHKLEYLTTPPQETGERIRYRVVELPRIDASINMSLDDVAKIAENIFQNYSKNDAFIVVTGLDTICHVGTTLSFML